MFDRIASIAKPYVQRFKKAVNKAIAFVKRNKKEIFIAAAGIVTGVGASVLARSLANAGREADWITDAFNFASNGDTDFLIASNSKSGESVLFAPDDVANVINEHSGIRILF